VSVPGLNVARTDSLCKLYDTGYARRFWGHANQANTVLICCTAVLVILTTTAR
jgi:hypothetical protein